MNLRKAKVLLLAAVMTGSCSGDTVYREGFYRLGTRVQLSLVPVPGRDPAADARAVGALLQRIQELTDPRLPDSALARLNREGRFDPDRAGLSLKEKQFWSRIFRTGQKLAAMTDGNFDPAVGGLTALWGFSGVPFPSRPPSAEAVSAALREKKSSRAGFLNGVYYLTGRAGWDPGGFVKGMAAMEVRRLLLDAGYRSAVIDLGGDLFLLGNSPRRKDGWLVGIRHPRQKGAYAGSLLVRDTAVVTSGDYERFYFWKSRRWHHLLDPRTGYPARRTISVTVTGPDAGTADGLATALFVSGPVRGQKLLQKFPGYHAMWAVPASDSAGMRWVFSPGFRRTVRWHGFSVQSRN